MQVALSADAGSTNPARFGTCKFYKMVGTLKVTVLSRVLGTEHGRERFHFNMVVSAESRENTKRPMGSSKLMRFGRYERK